MKATYPRSGLDTCRGPQGHYNTNRATNDTSLYPLPFITGKREPGANPGEAFGPICSTPV
jgi:hypothetical protein